MYCTVVLLEFNNVLLEFNVMEFNVLLEFNTQHCRGKLIMIFYTLSSCFK